jgi:iron complex transport system substrate-binding protein
VHNRLVVSLVAMLAALVLLGGASASQSAVPHRIVSLSPTATESLFAIGAGSQVIAVDDQSNYPKTAPKTKLSGFTPNVEAIASYKPDLVVLSFDTGGVVASLKKLKIRVLVQPAAADLKGAYAQILELGGVTGHAAKAKAVVAGMKQNIARIVAHAHRDPNLSVFHELEPDLYSATSSTFIGKVYALFGLKNIADAADKASDGGYPELSQEYIVAASPQVIFLSDNQAADGGQSPAIVGRRPGWSAIPAVKDSEIIGLNDDIASRWGPRLPQLIAQIASAVERAAA